jgi:hypothetical protein
MIISEILSRRYPGRKWVATDSESSVEFLDEGPIPTQEELEALWPEVEMEMQVDELRRQAVDRGRKILDKIIRIVEALNVSVRVDFKDLVAQAAVMLQLGDVEAARIVIEQTQVPLELSAAKQAILEVFNGN